MLIVVLKSIKLYSDFYWKRHQCEIIFIIGEIEDTVLSCTDLTEHTRRVNGCGRSSPSLPLVGQIFTSLTPYF